MLTIHLNAEQKTPLYEQIYLHIRKEIRSGELAEQTRLPSTRALASHLSVSRNTVDMAYNQLLSEGYIEARPKSGYYVCQLSEYAFAAPDTTVTNATVSGTSFSHQADEVPSNQSQTDHPVFDFSPFALNTEGFPYRSWQRLTRECLSSHGSELFLLGHPQGEASLRSAISEYLYEARGFRPDPNHILIGAGADYLLQLLVQLLDFPACIAMENPCYRQAYRIFSGLGCQVLPVPVDASGFSPDYLRTITSTDTCPVPRAIYLTPSHQYPTGLVLSAGRRQELLGWAKRTGQFLIEDDHDSEFRYKGKPIPALKEMDQSDSVIYIGTFSRSIAPAIRVGFMVLPQRLVEIYQKRFRHIACPVSRIDQMILSRFLTDGYYERHLNKSRKIYKGRHDALLQSLKTLGEGITVMGENAGLHVAVQFPLQNSAERNTKKEAEIISTASSYGIKLYGLRDHMLSPAPDYPPTILFGFGNLSEEAIAEGISLVKKSLNR